MGWTPEQVNDQDPHFLDELLKYFEASAEHDEKERKKLDRELKRSR